jgi:hypothetical protein
MRNIGGSGVHRNFRAARMFRAISRRGASARTWITRLPLVTPQKPPAMIADRNPRETTGSDPRSRALLKR